MNRYFLNFLELFLFKNGFMFLKFKLWLSLDAHLWGVIYAIWNLYLWCSLWYNFRMWILVSTRPLKNNLKKNIIRLVNKLSFSLVKYQSTCWQLSYAFSNDVGLDVIQCLLLNDFSNRNTGSKEISHNNWFFILT